MKRLIIFALALMVSLPVCALAEETLTIDGNSHEFEELTDDDGNARTYTTLKEALDGANELAADENSYADIVLETSGNSATGATITLSDYENLTKITITGTGRIRAPSGARHFVLDEPGIEFIVEGVTLEDNGGGGISITNGTPTFNGVTFSGINASTNLGENGGC